MTELNLERVSPHNDTECAAGLARLRDERNRARDIAVALEQECAHLEHQLNQAHGLNATLAARLTAHGLPVDKDDNITGAAV